MKFTAPLGLLAGLLALPLASTAQDYPSKPIRVIIPLSAGSLTDTMVRLASPKMSAALGTSMVVENMPGAGAVIGTVAGAKSAPDGYTVLVAVNSAFSVNPHVNKALPYNPVMDFAPVCKIGGSASVLAVNPGLGVKTLAELLQKAKTTPLSFASSGVGTTTHLAQEMFKARVGVPFVHVPYKGGPPAITDVVAGHAHLLFETPGAMLSQVQAGKLLALGITSPRRSASLPDVPTFDEMGFDKVILQGWIGLVVPVGTPEPIVNRLAQACQTALTSPDLQKEATPRGFDIDLAMPAEFGAFISGELAKVGQLVKLAGLKPE